LWAALEDERIIRLIASSKGESMPKPYATVFIHGLAKKPAPDKLRQIWLWGVARDNPNPAVFPSPNRGIDLGTQGVPALFNYYADVVYGTDYETDLQSYYEADDERAILDGEHLDRIEPDLKLPTAVTPRERTFVRNFEEKLGASAVLTAPRASVATTSGATPQSDGASDLEIASWLPVSVKQAVIKKAAMEAFYFLFDKEYERADGARFKVRQELRKRLLDDLKKAKEAGEIAQFKKVGQSRVSISAAARLRDRRRELLMGDYWDGNKILAGTYVSAIRALNGRKLCRPHEIVGTAIYENLSASQCSMSMHVRAI
jgi:hypothetical protein